MARTIEFETSTRSATPGPGRASPSRCGSSTRRSSSSSVSAGAKEPSFGAVHVQTDDVEAESTRGPAVRSAASRRIGRQCRAPRNGWTAVHDERCRQGARDAPPARARARPYWRVRLALGVEEGTAVRFVFFERGRVMDEYLSVPEIHGPLPPGDVIGLGANPTVVARLTHADPARVRRVARTAVSANELPPAPELIEQIADVLGVGAGYGYSGAAQPKRHHGGPMTFRCCFRHVETTTSRCRERVSGERFPGRTRCARRVPATASSGGQTLGYELIYAVTDSYCGKLLYVRAGEALSLQLHQRKDETIYVHQGRAEIELGTAANDMVRCARHAGRESPASARTVHRMRAIEDTVFLEVSTPELDDVVRPRGSLRP